MKPTLRDYQADLVGGIYGHWRDGVANVMPVSGTGTGKTRMMSHIVDDVDDFSMCVAHRKELVGQIAMALAESGVRHRIMAPAATVKWIARRQVDKVGRSFVYPNAKAAVAGIDTIIRPNHAIEQFAKKCALWNIDEGHHLLAENKWGKGAALFRAEAHGLAWTATPCRSDGKGLGRHAHGLMDAMVEGPPMREIINRGYLTDYRIVCARSHVEGLATGGSGEYTGKSVDAAMKKSRIVGEIVPTWFKHAEGKKTVVFAHNLDAARDIADEFNAAGINAAVVSSKNTDAERATLLDKFEFGAIQVLVNVDLFGEGFDLPAIECVVMARPTASLGLYIQQFGRVLRILEGKLYGLVIDHVGNVMNPAFGLPDRPRTWTLDAREKRKSDGPADVQPLRTCGDVTCLGVFDRFLNVCPYCGWVYAPEGRGGPEQVDGDLFMLDPDMLAQLRGSADRINLTPAEVAAEIRDKHGPMVAQAVAAVRHTEWQQAQTELRRVVELWSGRERLAGLDDPTICRKFYLTFGLDILTAYGIPRTADVRALIERVRL